jgi:hypothetical protein
MIDNFEISYDEKYMMMKDKTDRFYLCHFENGIEHDLFFE